MRTRPATVLARACTSRSAACSSLRQADTRRSSSCPEAVATARPLARSNSCTSRVDSSKAICSDSAACEIEASRDAALKLCARIADTK
jgi:hypothetical protein